MSPRTLAPTVLAVLLLGGLFVAVPKEPADVQATPAEAPASGGVAVVELFTSEGCSSCPPADRLLGTLVEEARSGERSLYALSFHVDYWNHLGWEDPYSDPAYSERQRAYAEALGARVYTPQMIVNGRKVLVGSREAEVRSAVEGALSEPATTVPELRLQSGTDESPSVRIALPEVPDDAAVQVALVERGLSQSVSRGENAGRTLRHTNVVRAFKTVPAEQSQVVTLNAPSDLDPGQSSIIAYVQDRRSKDVLGAARTELRDSSP
ncbi:MAG: DUF1223 domain-containing protein [Salinibacter sp.]